MEKNQFRSSVKDILNHISDAAYLENKNLLGLLLTPEEARQSQRIHILRNKISESIEVLRPPENTPANMTEWRCYQILTLRYLNLMEFHQIEFQLGLSQRQVQRDLKKGLDALISIIWSQLAQPENPPIQPDILDSGMSDSSDMHVFKEELINWEITNELNNLNQMIEQAVQLCELLLKKDLHERIDLSGIEANLQVMVDQTLTKQGLYKMIAIVGSEVPDGKIRLETRKISSHFTELTIQFDPSPAIPEEKWQVAQLFFTIQGVSNSIRTEAGKTIISMVLPLMLQSSCLVIDDVASVRRLIERMLGTYGIQVFGSGIQQEALNLAELVKPDFILLDILMPKVDGWQMIRDLKSNPNTSDIPVIICSVLNEPELSQQLGAVGYIRKPINRIELMQLLQEKGLIRGDLVDTK